MFTEETFRAVDRAIKGAVRKLDGLTDQEREDRYQDGWRIACALARKYKRYVPGTFAGYVSKAIARQFVATMRRERYAGSASDTILRREIKKKERGLASEIDLVRGDLDDNAVDEAANPERADLLARLRAELARFTDRGTTMLIEVVCDGEPPAVVAKRHGLTAKAAHAEREATAARLRADPALRALLAEITGQDDIEGPAAEAARVFVVAAPPASPPWIYSPGVAAAAIAPFTRGPNLGHPSSVGPAVLPQLGGTFASTARCTGPRVIVDPRREPGREETRAGGLELGALAPRCPPARWGPARAAPSG
jgi:hypothetical protein